jgi:uncharacterized protein YdeI (YjbR/CyaY-like superfamily)
MTSFYETPQEFRRWLRANHKKSKQLKVGFRLRPNGHACMALDEAAVEALKFGWCAVKRVAIDKTTFAVVFGPRPNNARWSQGDVAQAQALIADGTMTEAGLAVFAERTAARPKTDATAKAELSPLMLAELKRHPIAWTSFQRLPQTLREKSSDWVMRAKLEKTRADRFAKLLMDMSRPRK